MTSIICRATVTIPLPDDGTTEMQSQYTEDKFRPATAEVTYFADNGRDWRLSSVIVSGPFIRKNGSLSQAVSRDRRYGHYQTPLPALPPHIAALVEENQPRAFA